MVNLARYRSKRDFTRTNEPPGETPEKRKRRGKLAYVIQKHAARQLHYDFRLEIDGALISWAVPKGPSLDPRIKRLAQETEPHPLGYGSFEGTIPKGQYGGGTVMVWDQGSWLPEGDASQGYAKGHLSFTLLGEKLHGRWHLVRTKGGKDGKGWLLFKARDEAASETEIVDRAPNSVLTGRNLKQIAGGRSRRAAKKRGAKSAPLSTKESSNSIAGKRPASRYPLTHPDRVLYPEQGITKRDLLEYYERVAERMLPHVRHRPLTLVRCPNGRGKPCFFQKHPGEGAPNGVRSIPIREKSSVAPYAVIDDVEGLFALVQMGALEIHTWGSREADPERPDILVFDLDPDPSVDFKGVIQGAHALRRIFDALKLESFVKTTGGKGLHVCVPIVPAHSWDEIKTFSQRVARRLVDESPDRYIATQSKAQRKGKIYVDYLRNARGATFVAPYSTRARANAPIAAPVEWEELSRRMAPDCFTISNIEQRLVRLKTDPFLRLLEIRQKLYPERLEP